MANLIHNIVSNVLKGIINEAGFKQGESIVIQGDEDLGRKVIRLKYNMNPDDFDYVGNGKFVYKRKNSNKNKQVVQPKEKEFLGKREGESEEEYLRRVRELNSKFADVEKELPGEEWRPIRNTGRYFGGTSDYTKTHEVSNMGRIRIIDFDDPMRSRISNGYDAPTRNSRQFHLDTFSDNGDARKTTPPIHTLVADAWLEPPEGNIEDYDVEHIDGDYHNNRADNLRYVLKKGRRGRKANIETPFGENKQYNTNRKMRQTIRLTESELRNMIAESVKRVLNEDKSTSKMAYSIFDTKGNISNSRRPSKITKVDRSNSSNKHTMSPDEIEKIHNIVSEVSVAPKGGESKQSVRVSEAQLHQIVKESVQKIMNESWYNNWGDFKRAARNTAVGAAMAASTAAPLASCYQNNVQQTQNQPKVEYSQQVDPAYQMGKELVDIYNNYPLSTQQVKQKYGDQITNSFQYNGSQSLTKQQVQEYQRVGSKWTIVGNNGNGTFTVFFLR